MGLSIKERTVITKEVCERYRKTKNKQKKVILDEFCELTGYNRKYGNLVSSLCMAHIQPYEPCKDLTPSCSFPQL